MKSIVESELHDFSSLSKILIFAEDHRNQYHYGVDFIGIARTLKVRIFTGKSQGTSTIEQQFVRAITQRKERNIRRKIREQLLAVFIRMNFSRDDINFSYLCNAYYGEGKIGKTGVIDLLKRGHTEYEIISYIKFPIPSVKSIMHEKK